jgi:putative MFS transporter
MASRTALWKALLSPVVIVSALGYFVDIYDLILFSIVRKKSLLDLGVPEAQLLEQGVFLINMQMIGMLLGGLVWGVLGDKKGRLSVLFGSILLYSLANIANGYVTNLDQYAALRLIAGIGLAGELGAAVTLVSESMSKETRGYGTTLVASVGVLGAVLAAWIGDRYSWQTAYIIGGVLGLALLVLRISVVESGMFEQVRSQQGVQRGDVKLLLSSGERVLRYLACIAVGVPIWFVIGILITFSPELGKELGVGGAVKAGRAVMMAYIGLSLGDLASGLLSQFLRSRRGAILIFLGITAVFSMVYLNVQGLSEAQFYGICLLLGVGSGYWAMFVTVASEQFGTNLRATVTTTAPNFVRGAVVPLTLTFQTLSASGGLTLRQSAWVVGALSLALAVVGVLRLKESFARDLDYLET